MSITVVLTQNSTEQQNIMHFSVFGVKHLIYDINIKRSVKIIKCFFKQKNTIFTHWNNQLSNYEKTILILVASAMLLAQRKLPVTPKTGIYDNNKFSQMWCYGNAKHVSYSFWSSGPAYQQQTDYKINIELTIRNQDWQVQWLILTTHQYVRVFMGSIRSKSSC
jgi:hypothetical protein